MTTFQNIFKNGGHFEFSPKMRKHKNASISLTVTDRVISSTFSTPRLFKNYRWQLFTKFSKMAAILNFLNFQAKMRKHNILAIPLTATDRAISSKFSTPGCSITTDDNFWKKCSKVAAILNFRIFAKNAKTQKCFYLLNRWR